MLEVRNESVVSLYMQTLSTEKQSFSLEITMQILQFRCLVLRLCGYVGAAVLVILLVLLLY